MPLLISLLICRFVLVTYASLNINFFIGGGCGRGMAIHIIKGGKPPADRQIGETGSDIRNKNPQHTAWWYQVIADTCLRHGQQAFWGEFAEGEGAPQLALKSGTESDLVFGGAEISALTSLYTTSYSPGLSGKNTSSGLRGKLPGHDLLHLDCLSADEGDLNALSSMLKTEGYWVSSHRGFENWYEEISPGGFDLYWQKRPSQLKNTEKRKRRQAQRDHEFKVRIFPQEGDLEFLIADYQTIYENSWKEAEPDPDFMPVMMRAAAENQALRLGVLYLDSQPVAAQVWLVGAGAATIFKLAYDEKYKKYSPGSLLTADIARYVIEHDQVGEIDYGRGPDSYKKDWLSQCRHRYSLLAFNRTLRGFLGAFRHVWLAALIQKIRG